MKLFLITRHFIGWVKSKIYLCIIIPTVILLIYVLFLGPIKHFLSFICNFNPQSNFLTGILSFEAVVVGFAVPLSFNTVSRISERYRSEIISNKFMQEKSVKFLTPFLIANIITIVVVMFFLNVVLTPTLWRFIYYVILVGFIFCAVFLWSFFVTLINYTIDIRYPLKNTLKEIKNYFNGRISEKKQKALDHNLGGLGDILIFATIQINRNKIVLEGLEKIGEFLQQLFSLKTSDPEKFKELMYTPEFLKQYKGETNDIEAQISIAYDLDRSLVPFPICVNQILRIHKAAVDSKNQEISRRAAYSIINLLRYLSKFPDNEKFIGVLFDELKEAQDNAVKSHDTSKYPLVIGWYADIVFDEFNREKREFDLSYLSRFNSQFLDSIKSVVNNEETELFKYFVGHFIDQPHIFLKNTDWITNIINLIYQSTNNKETMESLQDKFKNLEDHVPYEYKEETFNNWFEELSEFKETLFPNLNEDQKDKLNKAVEEATKYTNKNIKQNSILDIFTFVGAYCLFKERPGYIRYMWEYNQPKDADGSWVNPDVIPSGIDDILDSLLMGNFCGYFFGEHHGSRIYFEQYLLLLLARRIEPWKKNKKGNYDNIERFDISKFDIEQLGNITDSWTDRLIKEAEELKNQKETLSNIGFDLTNIDELFDEKLILFIKSLKPKAEEEIRREKMNTPISKEKIEKFIEESLKAFNESAVIRNFFKKYGLYEDNTKVATGDKNCYSNGRIDDKAVFLDKWFEHYSNWGESYGENIAQAENGSLIKSIASECSKVEKDGFEKIISKSRRRSKLIIIGENADLYMLFRNNKNFIPSWHKDAPSKEIELKEHAGWYKYKEDYVPIFNMPLLGTNESFLLLLDKGKLGKLVQYYPQANKKSNCVTKDIFCFEVQAFSENQKILDEFLKDPPAWLKKQGNKDQQKEYLLDKVLIRIYECFVFKKYKNFKGYILKLNKITPEKLL